MPKKKGGGGKAAKGASKVDQKKREKVIEDKTFGLKNKKGKKQQQHIQQIRQAASQADHRRGGGAQGMSKKERNAALMAEVSMMSTLFKPMMEQKIEKGVDPKSVVCEFFKKGKCQKGMKCKFSHNLAQGRKGAKRDIYSDGRDAKEADTMDKWDQAKLEDVVRKKQGNSNKQTEIICKHFLKAIEGNLYGWFWVCPDGGDKCQYRHALPPGYVLKRDRKKEDEGEKISLEALIDEERKGLGPNVHKVTFDSFMAWKKRKIAEKKKALAKETAKKKKNLKEGKSSGITGRDMFSFNPELASAQDDDDDGGGFDEFRRPKLEADGEGVAVDVSVFESVEITAEDYARNQAELERIEKMRGSGSAAATAADPDPGTDAAAAAADEAAAPPDAKGKGKGKGKAKAAAAVAADPFAGLEDLDVDGLPS